jgi:serine/threonine protein phosphatase 1
MNTAIVGDIHGDVDRLRVALHRLTRTVDEIIFVGDYVDRGQSSRLVIEELCKLKGAWGDRATLLRGNHDHALLKFLEDGDRTALIAHGGLTTVKSYLIDRIDKSPLDQFRAAFPREHLNLLTNTEIFLERDGLLVSHCGYNPAAPESRTVEDMVSGQFPTIFRLAQPRPREFIVFGHYIQHKMKPYIADGIACIDTGCGTLPDGPLTAILLPSQQFMQF